MLAGYTRRAHIFPADSAGDVDPTYASGPSKLGLSKYYKLELDWLATSTARWRTGKAFAQDVRRVRVGVQCGAGRPVGLRWRRRTWWVSRDLPIDGMGGRASDG